MSFSVVVVVFWETTPKSQKGAKRRCPKPCQLLGAPLQPEAFMWKAYAKEALLGPFVQSKSPSKEKYSWPAMVLSGGWVAKSKGGGEN